MNLLDVTLPAIKDTPIADLQKMISETPDFDEVTGKPVMLSDDDVRAAARKYIRTKLDLGDETPQEKEEAHPDFVPKAQGFEHVNTKEVADPQEAMIKAGFQNADEMLKMLEAIRRDSRILDIRKNELDAREVKIKENEAVLAGKEASLEKKAAQVGRQYAEYQELFARVEAARKQGVIS